MTASKPLKSGSEPESNLSPTAPFFHFDSSFFVFKEKKRLFYFRQALVAFLAPTPFSLHLLLQ